MNSTLVYSFRTNKHLEQLQQVGTGVFIFGKLRDDLAKFEALIRESKPRYIIGLAEIKTQSRLETLAINAFGKTGSVSKGGKNSYALYVPTNSSFHKSKKSTRSFCNWTMYKVSERINPENIKVSFLHFNKTDIPKLLDFVKNLSDPSASLFQRRTR